MKEVAISEVDVLFTNRLYPIEFLFYYRQGIDTKRVRLALRKLSSAFWPVFGEYKSGRISFDAYREEDFFAEEAVSDELDIQTIDKSGSEFCARYCLPDLKKLFFLKAVRLKKGVALIPKMAHLAGDGYSYFYFLSFLAELSRPAAVSFKSRLNRLFFRPHHRRTALKDFVFQGVEAEQAPQDGRFGIEFDEILREDVRSIVREAADSDHFRISTNDVLSALAMKKIVAKQAELWREDVRLTIPIDIRRKIKEYGRRFFGNGIMLHSLKIDRESVKAHAAKDIAITIRKSMPSASKDSYIGYLTELGKTVASEKAAQLRPFDPDSGVLVTNLSRLPADRLDFGAGRPDLIIPLTRGKNSAAILAQKENFILRYAY